MRTQHNVIEVSPQGLTVSHHKSRLSARRHIERITDEWRSGSDTIVFEARPIDYRRRRRQKAASRVVGFEVNHWPVTQTFELFYEAKRLRD